jgi:phosphohistidine phosphatase
VEKVEKLMIVGHNPGLHQLALKLAKSGDEALLDELMLKYPTSTFSAFDLGAINWRDTGSAKSVLKMFITPKHLTGINAD